jgi:hypothetical protein
MLNRNQFLGTLLALPFGIFLVRCSSDSSGSSYGGSSGAGGAPPTQSNGTHVYTSSLVNAHQHTFTLDDSAITTPPAAGVQGNSSTDASHFHAVSIATDQLAQVATGASVEITSGTTSGHAHVFTFVKIA